MIFGSSRLTSREPVRAVYTFRRGFESFALARSILERTGDDGRLRSRFFCGGIGARVKYLFEDWRSVLKGDHFTLTLVHPLQSVMFWLAGETNDLLDMRELANDWSSLRARRMNRSRLPLRFSTASCWPTKSGRFGHCLVECGAR
jgi:hypothetical protein